MNLKEKDFIYNGCIEYKYEYARDCDSYGCDSICRCGRIEDASVEVDMTKLVEELYEFYLSGDTLVEVRDNKLRNLLYGTNKEFDLYTIDRIVRKYRLWDSCNWDIEVVGGYYGQELESITIDAGIANQIDTYMGCAFSLSFNEQVELLIRMEYETILDDLKDVDYEIVTLETEDIILSNVDYKKSLVKEHFTHYDDYEYDGIRGIVLLKNGRYKLIDGYHRMTTTKSKEVRVILAKSK
jgi:hypothetical protein